MKFIKCSLYNRKFTTQLDDSLALKLIIEDQGREPEEILIEFFQKTIKLKTYEYAHELFIEIAGRDLVISHLECILNYDLCNISSYYKYDIEKFKGLSADFYDDQYLLHNYYKVLECRVYIYSVRSALFSLAKGNSRKLNKLHELVILNYIDLLKGAKRHHF